MPLILFLISPIISVYFFVILHYSRISKFILLLFCLYFGLTYNFEIPGSDGSQKAKLFLMLANNQIVIRNYFGDLFYNDHYHLADIIEPLVMFLVAKITYNPTVLFTIFGLLIGIVYSKLIDSIINLTDRKLTLLEKSILSFLITLVPFWGIGNFRFLFALLLFLLNAVNGIFYNKKITLLQYSIPLISHLSLLTPTIILISYFYFPLQKFNLKFLFLIFFITTIFNFSNELKPFVQNNASKKLQDTYLNDDYIDSLNESKKASSWFIPLCEKINKYFLLVLISYFIYSKIDMDHLETKKLLVFLTLGLTVGNISSYFPSGARLLIPFYFLTFIYFLNNLVKYFALVQHLKIPMILALLFVSIITIRLGMDEMNIALLISSPILYLNYSEFSSVWENLSGLIK